MPWVIYGKHFPSLIYCLRVVAGFPDGPIFTAELAIKVTYGSVIKLSTRSAFEVPLLTTAVVVSHLSPEIEVQVPDIEILKRLSDGSAVVTLPRYAPFNSNIRALAREGVRFIEIAGNTSAILVTVLAPEKWPVESGDYCILFDQPMVTKPGIKRVALATPVGDLHKVLLQLQEEKIVVEHVYDF